VWCNEAAASRSHFLGQKSSTLRAFKKEENRRQRSGGKARGRRYHPLAETGQPSSLKSRRPTSLFGSLTLEEARERR